MDYLHIHDIQVDKLHILFLEMHPGKEWCAWKFAAGLYISSRGQFIEALHDIRIKRDETPLT